MSKTGKDAAEIARYISSFLNDYAPSQLTNSENTLHGYETALTLYIAYLEACGTTVSSFSAKCFEQETIENWLVWLADTRKCGPETCNNRLAAIRVFTRYLSSRDARYLYLKAEAENVPQRKTSRKKTVGLTRRAVSAILAEPDQKTKTGVRDLTFLTVLYGTAARMDEMLSMKIKHLHLDAAKPYITIVGKGDKVRTLYLLPKAVGHLKRYIQVFHGTAPLPEAYVFFSRNSGTDGKMSQSAIRKMIKKYAVSANKKCAEVPLGLHAHQFRHAKATHWLEDGINIIQISFLLGHEQMETTMRYLDITTEQEAAALATLEEEHHKDVKPKWNPEKDSLAAICNLRKIKK